MSTEVGIGGRLQGRRHHFRIARHEEDLRLGDGFHEIAFRPHAGFTLGRLTGRLAQIEAALIAGFRNLVADQAAALHAHQLLTDDGQFIGRRGDGDDLLRGRLLLELRHELVDIGPDVLPKQTLFLLR